MCQNCGVPDNVRCQCEVTQPFCDQCADDSKCVEKIDAQCVFFHLNCVDNGRLPNLGIDCNTDLETILEILDDLIGNSLNIPFQGQNTSTIEWVPNGPAGHKPSAKVKISADAGNVIEEHADGIFAPTPDVPPTPIFVDETNDCISLHTTLEEDGYHIVPSLDIPCLIAKIKSDWITEFCELVSQCQCLIPVGNLDATFAPACPPDYDLVDGECVKIDVIPATPGETTYNLQARTAVPWSKGGTIVFKSTFNNNGSGPGTNISTDDAADVIEWLTTPNVWCNTTSTPFSGTETVNLGPMNRCAVWSNPYNASTTFVIPISVPSTGIYFIGLGVDNVGSIDITYPDNTSANILTQSTAGASAYYLGSGTWNFDFWNIYPVTLQAGINFVSVSGTDSGGQFGFGMEIYNDTVANIMAATLNSTYLADPTTFPYGSNHYSGLNLLFSTRCARQAGSITANSATCPATYILDTTSGTTPTPPCQSINNPVSNWTCRKVLTAAFSGYVATLVWDRIPAASNYTVQQKHTGDPDGSYVAAVGSPVANPGSGSTVSLIVSGLDTDSFTFRVRPNFEETECSGPWSTVST